LILIVDKNFNEAGYMKKFDVESKDLVWFVGWLVVKAECCLVLDLAVKQIFLDLTLVFLPRCC